MQRPTWNRTHPGRFTTTWHGEAFHLERFEWASWHLHRHGLNELGHHPNDALASDGSIPRAQAEAALALNGWCYSPGHRDTSDGQPLYERLGAHRRRDVLLAELAKAPKAPVSNDLHAAYRQHITACRTCGSHTIWEKHTRCADAGRIDRDRGQAVMAQLADIVAAHPTAAIRETLDAVEGGFAGWVARFVTPEGISGWIGLLRHARHDQNPWQAAAARRDGDQLYARHDAYPLTAAQAPDAITRVVNRVAKDLAEF